MVTVLQTDTFSKWLHKLRDRKAKAIVAARLLRLQGSNFGDHRLFDGIGELRIHYGPGYRVYFVDRKTEIVILLCGGNKSSQQRDIEKAKKLAEEV